MRSFVCALSVWTLLPACSADFAGYHIYDFSNGSDLGSAPSDQGLLADGPSARFSVEMADPTAWMSGVRVDAPLTFYVLLGSATQAEVDQWLQVAARGTTAPLGGGFAWTPNGSGSGWMLQFLPSAPLTDLTDYVVRADDPRVTPSTVLHAGFSTGSHPRVIHVTVSELQVGFEFSEAMDPVSVQTAAAGGVLLDGVVIPGTVSQVADARHYLYTFATSQAGKSGTITLHITATSAKSASGAVALDPMSWDSPTKASDGSFRLDFVGASFSAPPPMWSPTVL